MQCGLKSWKLDISIKIRRVLSEVLKEISFPTDLLNLSQLILPVMCVGYLVRHYRRFISFLIFNHHTNTTVGKTFKVLNFIKQSTKIFTLVSCFLTFQLYFVLVHSVFKFGVIIWHCYSVKDNLRIEWVQNKFLSFLK